LATVRREHLQGNRVAKKLNPGQAGTKRLLRTHGDALVCVRYRHDRMKLYRFTTIELVIAAAPLHARRFDIATFGIRLEHGEQELHRAVRAAGARWDPGEGLWWLRGALIRKLDLVHRIRKT
jgi:hypothetical protein